MHDSDGTEVRSTDAESIDLLANQGFKSNARIRVPAALLGMNGDPVTVKIESVGYDVLHADDEDEGHSALPGADNRHYWISVFMPGGDKNNQMKIDLGRDATTASDKGIELL